MSSIGILLVLVSSMAILQVAYGAVGREIVTPDPSDPNKCPATDDRPAMTVGETKTISGCVQAQCTKTSEGQLMIMVASCGTMSFPEECKKVEDLSKPYPDCCPKPVCP